MGKEGEKMDKYELDELRKTLKTEIKAEIKADLDLVWDDEDQNNRQRQFNKQINYNVLTEAVGPGTEGR